jgi:hypothetical protein
VIFSFGDGRLSPGSIHALAAHAGELIAYAEALDYRGSEYQSARRSLHGGGRGVRVFELPNVRTGDQFGATLLWARAPDDVVLLGAAQQRRDAGLREDRSMRFDGRRWRAAATLRDGTRHAVVLADGRLFVVGEDGLWAGWPGSRWAPVPGETARIMRIAGSPEDFWARTLAVRTRPGTLQHWREGAMVEELPVDARGVYRFGPHVLATERDRVLVIRDGRATPITIPPTGARASRSSRARRTCPGVTARSSTAGRSRGSRASVSSREGRSVPPAAGPRARWPPPRSRRSTWTRTGGRRSSRGSRSSRARARSRRS